MRQSELHDPRTIGPYRILARIAVGGMGIVYLGRSRGGRAVAVKVMHPEFARRPELRERFRHEVVATRSAGGGYSAPVLDADSDATPPWMATEFLPSVTLHDAVERFGRLPAGSLRRLAAGLAEALAAIHRAGIVHLDVKPANVLLTATGPRLIDFGIAGGAQETPAAGSWGFMSPEQVAGHAGPPSDVYSLGATLEYAGGRQNLDRAMRRLIADCRRPDPADRPTAAELTDRLAASAVRDADDRDAGGVEDEGPNVEGPDAAWLPPPVLAAIDVAAAEADNPPASPTRPPRRRPLLLGAAAAAVLVAVAGGTAAVRAMTAERPATDTAQQTPQAPPAVPGIASASTPPSPSPPPTTKPVPVEFVVTGSGPLTVLAYGVNGELTILRNVRLPWRATIEVPRQPGYLDWQLRFTALSRTTWRVLVDGSENKHGDEPERPEWCCPYDIVQSGSLSMPGFSPGFGE